LDVPITDARQAAFDCLDGVSNDGLLMLLLDEAL
jgi:hypothetical protein